MKLLNGTWICDLDDFVIIYTQRTGGTTGRRLAIAAYVFVIAAVIIATVATIIARSFVLRVDAAVINFALALVCHVSRLSLIRVRVFNR